VIFDLVLCHLLDLEHDLIEAVLINQTMSQSVALIKEEVDAQISEDVLLVSLNQILLDLL
jgi:hypothetical protein